MGWAMHEKVLFSGTPWKSSIQSINRVMLLYVCSLCTATTTLLLSWTSQKESTSTNFLWMASGSMTHLR